MLLNFILHFPVGETRLLKNHINFLIANIEYQHDSGRLSVVQMLEVKPFFRAHFLHMSPHLFEEEGLVVHQGPASVLYGGEDQQLFQAMGVFQTAALPKFLLAFVFFGQRVAAGP
jgi:hypothetical protein